MASAPYAQTVEEVLDEHDVTLDEGLSEDRAAELLARFGENKLDEPEAKSIWTLIEEQFDDLLVKILVSSAFISFLLAYVDEESESQGWTPYVEPLVIILILFANAFVGVWQESNAEKALDALKKLQPDRASVLRTKEGKNGSRSTFWKDIDATLLVPGDIIEVRVGDKVPADMRMVRLKTTTIRIEQSQLTGESQSVQKEIDPIDNPDCVIQEKTNMLFASTTVANGSCLGIVTGTGMNTEIGQVQKAVTEAAEEESSTPLQKKLDEFSELLAKVIFLICAVVWVINYKHFFDPAHGTWVRGAIYYFKIAVALAVAAIPEGLPAVITTCLALGTRKMAQRSAIVRKLPSVETLGCTTVICSDKTGTLTTNEMCCKELCLPISATELKTYNVDGHSYEPVGEIADLDCDFTCNQNLRTFAMCAALCNESRISVEAGKGGSCRYVRTGEPTEAAIRVLVEKLGCSDDDLNARCLQAAVRSPADAMAFSEFWDSYCLKLATLEFTRERKSMSVLVKNYTSDTGNMLFVKGAPESILERCTDILLPDGCIEPLTYEAKQAIQEKMLQMASGALRTLAFAVSHDLEHTGLANYSGPSDPNHVLLTDSSSFGRIEVNLCFLGLVGIIDPPRPECKPAIKECRKAGISVIMITGDNKVTAEAIASKIGILRPEGSSVGKSFTGQEFDRMTDSEKRRCLQRIMHDRHFEGAVFSRTEPKHKQDIVRILKSIGEISAMTGDGVNDAPALKQADIGIAMGIAGTEVAKEASDMVLADDNFSSIVAAVEEGRSIYNNMKAFIRYLISSNIGEVASIFITAAIGIPEGLVPVQLLWVNLVTDGMPATALGFNPPDLNVMSKPPRSANDNLISGWVFFRYMVVGIYVGLATVGIFVYWYVYDDIGDHTLVSFGMLSSWGKCVEWKNFKPKNALGFDFSKDPCLYFAAGKMKASTLSLTVLVMIEMFNAFNALSEDGSLLSMPPWRNPYLILACMGSVSVHFLVLYTPFLAGIFNVCPLTVHDWVLVLQFSFPVIIVDEVLKFIGRMRDRNAMEDFDKTH